MKLLILFVIGIILFFIARNYKTEKYQNINIDKKELFNGNLKEHEAGLLVSLMAKVAKADGKVCELEAEILKHTFTDISSHFQNSSEIRDALKSIYKEEKESFENTIEIAKKFLRLSKFDYKKRVKVLEYLLNLAFIDGEFSHAEYMIIEDIANALEIKRTDFEAMINSFEMFYQNRAQEKGKSIDEAYKILNSNPSDDMATIKKNYRKLVKENHPDIIAGRGESQNIIDEATRKLQEINEAYEIIKKAKGE